MPAPTSRCGFGDGTSIQVLQRTAKFLGFAWCLTALVGLAPYAISAEDCPGGKQSELIKSISDSIQRNDAQIMSIQFRAEIVYENALVKKEETIVYEGPEGRSITRSAPRFEEQYQYVLKGRDFRREQVKPERGSLRIFVVNQGRQVDYSGPNDDLGVGPQAWINWYPAIPDGNFVDPRCIGLGSRTTSVIDWLRQVRVEKADIMAESKDINVRATDDRGQRVEVTFSHAHSYLPTKISTWNSDGSIFHATAVTYQVAPGTQAWFVHQAVQRVFGPGEAQTAEATNWRVRMTFTVQEGATVNYDVPAGTLNPVLPAGVLFIDGISDTKRTQSFRLSEAKPAFDVVDKSLPAPDRMRNNQSPNR